MAAEYLLDFSDGKRRCVLSAEASPILDSFRSLQKTATSIEATFAGALAAQILCELEWVASFDIHISSSAEFDDQGGCYNSLSVSILDVVPVEGAHVPDEFLDGDNGFDAALAACEIETFFEDGLWDFNDCFRPQHDSADFRLSVRRDEVADLLNSHPISGFAVFSALWPEHSSRVSALAGTKT